VITATALLPRLASFAGRPASDPLGQRNVGTGLGRRAARGATATIVTQWARFMLSTASTIVLARLLTPREYGLVGMVSALLGIGDALWNLGLQTATIQRRTITQAQVSFFFWLQVSLGLLLSLIACACAALVVDLYGQPELYPIVYAYSSVFLLGGLLAQHRAVLFRQMRFSFVAVVDVVALGTAAVVAVLIALAGGSYWALVAQPVVMLAVQCAAYWYSSGWRPGRPRLARGMWPMLSFGANLSLTNLLGYIGQNADNVLIGKVYGGAALGVYSRAYNLLLLPVRQLQNPMGRVAVPVLSYLQDQPERYRRYYHAASSALCYLAMPLMTTLAALAPAVIDILLGPKWKAAAPIFAVLAIAGTLQVLRGPNSWIYTSTGHTGRQATWALFSQPVLVASFFVGIHWGVVGIAWAYTITNLVVLIPAFIWAVQDTPLRLSDVWAAGWRPALLSVLTFGTAFGARLLFDGQGSWTVLGGGMLGAAAVMVLAFACWPTVRREILELRAAFTARAPARPGHSAARGPAGQTVDEPTADATGVAQVDGREVGCQEGAAEADLRASASSQGRKPS
jgi:PST family polysaccharide transporter